MLCYLTSVYEVIIFCEFFCFILGKQGANIKDDKKNLSDE